ncbi:hypothetical protein V7056_10780 [Bacillus sp. JJ664]
MEYRGIQLDEKCLLYKKTGEFHPQIKNSLDKLADMLEEKNHILKSTYKNSKEKVLIDFNCGHIAHSIVPNSYTQGHGCPKCAGSCPIQAKERIVKLVKERNHELLNEYVNAGTKLNIDYKCGHSPHWIKRSDYIRGRGCPKCYDGVRGIKKSKKSELELMSMLEENGHEWVEGEYKGKKSRIAIDFKCGHPPHWTTADNYKMGNRCPKCSGHCSIQAKLDLIEMLKRNGHEWVEGDYKGNFEKIGIDFKCGHPIHWISPNLYKKHGRGCPICGREKTNQMNKDRSEKARLKLIKTIKNNGHEWVKGDYKGNFEKIAIDFKCGHPPHWITPGHYKSGKKCSKCQRSNGEDIICDFLEKNKINHESRECLPRKRFQYDIIIPSQNLIIEVHGIQHFEFHEHFHRTEAGFRKEQENDRNKKEYAERLGYFFMVIDYREHEPQLALERFLKAYREFKLKQLYKVEKGQLTFEF